MLWTALTHKSAECLEVLLKHSPNLFEEYGRSKDTPLHVATAAGFVAGVKQLLGAMAPAEIQMITELPNATRWTPLAAAVHNAQPEVFKLLLDAGAKRNPPLDGDDTLLHLAARAELASSELIASIVEDCKVDVHQVNKEGLAALHVAAAHNSFDTAVRVRLLVLHGANINAVDGNRGMTPLHHAALGGVTGALDALLEQGADASATFTDRDGQVMTPLQAAGKNGVKATQDFFKAHA